MLEVMSSSNHELVFILNVSNLTWQIVFDGWMDSMNVDSKLPIDCENSGHTPSWQFYLHCGIEGTGSHGIICIVCHQVLCHPLQHGTSPMGKHFLTQAHIAKLNEVTESQVNIFSSLTVDETVLAILKCPGS